MLAQADKRTTQVVQGTLKTLNVATAGDVRHLQQRIAAIERQVATLTAALQRQEQKGSSAAELSA
jgi:polyhydroxyalkanoate synthesis regulator phasin